MLGRAPVAAVLCEIFMKKLGKKPVRHDPRTLRLSKYLTALPPVPTTFEWSAAKTNWGIMLNDQIGDCTIAAAGHMIESWRNVEGNQISILDSAILTAYEAVSGYNPSDPSTDTGAVCLDVLNYWRKTGISGDKIQAYIALDQGNVAQLKAAIYLFGAAYIGLAMPLTAQNQTEWHITSAGLSGDGALGSWGGHAVPILGYGRKTLSVVSWGQIYQMTNAALADRARPCGFAG
jgi:hypothetical protein